MKKCTQYITTKTVKPHWNDYLKQKGNGLWDIHIHVLIKTVEQDVENEPQQLDYSHYLSSTLNRGREYVYNNMLNYLIHAKDYQKYQYALREKF